MDDGYILEIGSGRFSIKADDDEQAKTEAKKEIGSMGALRRGAVLYHTRVVTKFPAKPAKRELRDSLLYSLYYDNL